VLYSVRRLVLGTDRSEWPFVAHASRRVWPSGLLQEDPVIMVAELLAAGQRLKNLKRRQVRKGRRPMRYRVLLSFILVLLVTVASAGCAGGETPAIPSDEPTMPSTPTPEPQPTTSVPTPSTAPTAGSVPPEAQDVVTLAREDLAQRLVLPSDASRSVGIAVEDLARRLRTSPDTITVAAVMRQEFPAHAFDCRTTKGRATKDESPLVIPGASILLSAAGHTYEYHASDQAVIFCWQLRSPRHHSDRWP
jgi:hypothetical protein